MTPFARCPQCGGAAAIHDGENYRCDTCHIRWTRNVLFVIRRLSDDDGAELPMGERLRQLRVKAALSLRELQDVSGIPHLSLWRLENGKSELTVTKARALAYVYGLSLDELVGKRRD